MKGDDEGCLRQREASCHPDAPVSRTVFRSLTDSKAYRKASFSPVQLYCTAPLRIAQCIEQHDDEDIDVTSIALSCLMLLCRLGTGY